MRHVALMLAAAAMPALLASAAADARQSPAIDVSGFAPAMTWRNIGPLDGDAQPAASTGRIATDADFPYRVCSSGTGGGSACVAKRGASGAITMRDWDPLAFGQDGGIATDPNDPNIVIGGRLARYDRRTGQTHDVRPPSGEFSRAGRAAPILYPPAESRALLYGTNAVWRSNDNGEHWTRISNDLTRGGAIATIAASAVDPEVIWAGTDDGLVHLTRDAGKTWANVTPPDATAPASVSRIDASHFDTRSAYAALDAVAADDRRAHLYRTRDNGQTWVDITAGLAAGTTVHVVREDPVRRGLLFAGTAESVYVSFDDGDSWQPLTFNLPATAVRDIVIKGDDVIVGTEARGIWILDDMTPLRQITADILERAGTFLFRPAAAWRVRARAGQPQRRADATSWPNPPDGATINYLIGTAATGPVTLEIIEYPPAPTATPSIVPGRPSGRGNGRVIRRYSSEDAGEARIPATPGLHRVVWDLAAERARGPLALPGTYTIRLTVNGRAYAQALILRQDPRVRTSMADLTLQYTLSRRLIGLMDQLQAAARAATASARRDAIDAAYAPLPDLYARLQDADARPTAALEAEIADAIARAERALAGGPPTV